MEEKKKRGLQKKALNPFRVTFDQRGGVSRRSIQCIKVAREGDNYVIRYKDARNTLCSMELPTAEWSLRGESEILFEDVPKATVAPVSPVAAQAVATPSNVTAFPSKDPYAPGRIDPRTGEQCVPFVETPGDLGKTVAEKEYNNQDPENWKAPKERIPLEVHVANNFATAESRRRAELRVHRAEVIEKAERLGSGWGIE